MFDFDGFFDDLEIQDFAWIGGAVGCLEEAMNERIRIEREMDRELKDEHEVTDDSPEELY